MLVLDGNHVATMAMVHIVAPQVLSTGHVNRDLSVLIIPHDPVLAIVNHSYVNHPEPSIYLCIYIHRFILIIYIYIDILMVHKHCKL